MAGMTEEIREALCFPDLFYSKRMTPKSCGR